MENIEQTLMKNIEETKPLDQQKKEIDDKYAQVCADMGHLHRIVSQMQSSIAEKLIEAKSLSDQAIAIVRQMNTPAVALDAAKGADALF